MDHLHDTSGHFVDTICNTHTLNQHMDDIDCHFRVMVDKTSQENACVVSFPYPVGKTFPVSTGLPPPIFQLNHYLDRLQKNHCTAVFRQYTVLAIHEANAAGRVFPPTYTIAPMKTSIQFFNPTVTTPTPLLRIDGHSEINRPTVFSISETELHGIRGQTLPSNFNWMDNPQITRPPNQGLCGSCWAVAAATGLSDVYVVSQGIPNPHLSPDYILSCLPQNQCDGGNPFLAIHEMEQTGLRPSSCITTSGATTNQQIPPCKCAHSSPSYFPVETQAICIPPNLLEVSTEQAQVLQSYLLGLYGTATTVNLSTVPYTDVQQIIQHHIYKYGPVVTGFHVFKNFMKGDYRETNDIYIETEAYQGINGIRYDDLAEDWIGSHAVVIVGWGQDRVRDTMVRYWVVRNSWGSEWGITQGMFKMAMYGTTPLQNRVSQFEYPSVVTSDVGYGVTGGVLLMKSGPILPPSLESVYSKMHIPMIIRQRRWTLFMLLVITLVVMFVSIFYLRRSWIGWTSLILFTVCSVIAGIFLVNMD